MFFEQAREALTLGKCLELRYSGFSRLVEVHAVGYSKAGNAVMCAWQLSGGSVSGESTGWKLMKLDEAIGAVVSNQLSQAPRPGYRRGDKRMTKIISEL
jgi:hypothetical protein